LIPRVIVRRDLHHSSSKIPSAQRSSLHSCARERSASSFFSHTSALFACLPGMAPRATIPILELCRRRAAGWKPALQRETQEGTILSCPYKIEERTLWEAATQVCCGGTQALLPGRSVISADTPVLPQEPHRARRSLSSYLRTERSVSAAGERSHEG